MRKVFGIGMSRTGTTSLAIALRAVNYSSVIHYPTKKTLFAGQYSAAFDIPVANYYKQLDKAFARSKFIYTVRDKDSWLASMDSYFARRGRFYSKQQYMNRVLLYGQYDFDRDVYSAAYDKHHNDVMQHFETRPNDLLVMDICGGDGWATLLPFLNINASVGGFPYKHKQTSA